MENNLKETRNLRLENPVVVRKVPMTAKGCDMLRAIREYQSAEFKRQKGISVEIPFPTAIHLLMADYCAAKGIKVESEPPSTNRAADIDS